MSIQCHYEVKARTVFHNNQTGEIEFRARVKKFESPSPIDARNKAFEFRNKFIYGLSNRFSYKNVECNFLIQGSYGNKTMNWDKTWLEGTYGTSNVGKVALNYWTPANQNTNIERPTQVRNNSYGGNTNDHFVEDASYIRLRSIQIAYRLPQNIMSKLGVSNFKVSVGIDNLITITKYTGLDSDSNSSYPIPRTVSIGINATL